MALPLESLIEDYSYSAGTVSGSDFPRNVTTVFSCNIVLPSSPTQEGTLFEIGGAGQGSFVGLRDSGATFRLRCGDGAATLSASSSDCALLDIDTASSSYFDGNSHDVAWEFRNNPGSVRLWIDGDLVGESYTSGYGALDAGQYSGGDNGGYGVTVSSSVVGEPTTSWPYTLNSSLSVYSGQGVLTDGFRITETSDARIDESGNVRVTESLLEGFSALSGAGSTSFVPSKNTPVSVSVSGSGSATTDPDVNRKGIVTLSGSGAMSSTADVSIQVTLSTGGAASITADPDVNSAGVVNISGTGSVTTAEVVEIRSARSSLASIGSKITEVSYVGNAVITMGATGTMSVTSIRIKNSDTSLSGSGTATFLGLNSFDISKSLSGVGTANFNGLRTKNASTSLSASGTLNNDGFNLAYFGSFSGEDITYTRVTEAGDTRIDEDSNVRVVIQPANPGESVLSAEVSYIAFSSAAYVKWDGVWTQFDPKVKQDGTWDDPLAIYKKIDANTWKRAY
jgi:hypothetical protein